MKSDLKNRLKLRFKRALPSYDQAAVVQTEMANKLVNSLLRFSCRFNRVLEIGSGTGLLTKKALKALEPKFYLASDLVEASFIYLINNLNNGKQIYFVVGDGEDPSWVKGPFDLIISNATFQWFVDFSLAIKRLHKCLRQGGILAFTTFGPLTMWEILEAVPGHKRLHLIGEQEISTLTQGLFEILYKESWISKLYFHSTQEVLKHIRVTGALGFLSARWSLIEIKAWERRYLSFKGDNGLPVTYQPLLFVLEKK